MAQRTARRVGLLCKPQPAVFQTSAVGDDLRCTRQSRPSCAVGSLILTVTCIGRHTPQPSSSQRAGCVRKANSVGLLEVHRAMRSRRTVAYNHIEGTKEYLD